jgi:HlyD family secretion protein
MKRRSIALSSLRALALVFALGAAAGCGAGGGSGRGTTSGHVEATDVRLSAKVGGRIVRFDLKEGDRVTAGTVVAEIDTTDTDLAIAAARAERAAAAAELRLRQAGARREDIAEAEAQVANIRSELAGAQRELDRFQGLLDSGSGATKTRDDAATRRDSLKAQLDAAEQRATRLRRGSRAEEIDAAAARVATADARLAQLEQQRADATIAAPVAGVITEKTAERGELVSPGTPIAVLTNLEDAWLTIYVGGPDLPGVALGESVNVVTDAGDRRTGKVTYIASQAEFTPKNVQTRDERVKLVYKVKVALPNGDGLFKPGMPAEADLAAGR